MSKDLICPECQSANTPGSKFCNNCGHRLPPSTSLICPNCSTPNPRDRFYCDKCGSRLVKEAPATKEPEEDKPLPQTGTFFSLPARPPGQTGELDPLQIVPDWLKKQADEPQEQESEEDLRLRMPKIEEVGPSKKVTDDLPDWLVGEHDSDPIIGSPRVITTEHFMNLVQPPAGDDAEDLSETADSADLPDWLTDLAAAPDTGDKVVHSGDLSTPDDALNEWLASISGDEEAESQPDAADDLTAQLARLSRSDGLASDWTADEEEEEIATDWLTEAALEPPLNDEQSSGGDWKLADDDWDLTDGDSLSGLETEDKALGGEMFDWMTENLVDTGMLDPSVVADTEPDMPDAETDWLTGFTDSVDEAGVAQEAADEAARDTVTGWLDEAAFGEADANVLADLTDAVAQHDMDTVEGELPGWVSEIASQVEADDMETAVPLTSESQPDWMAEFTTADSEAFAQQLESKLEALEEDADSGFAAGFTDELSALAGDGDEWLADNTASDEIEAAEPDEVSEAVDDLAVEPESLPDWLSGLGGNDTLVTEPSDSDDIFTDLFAPVEADSDILDWISDEEPATEFGLPLEADETEAAETAAMPETDWLSEMVAMGDEAFAAEEAELAADTEAPQPPASPFEEPASDLFAADWPEEELDDDTEQEDTEAGASLSEWGNADSLLVDALDEELPDWLDELGAPVGDGTEIEPEGPASTSESMPDWIAQMKPGSGFSGSGLIESSGLPDLTESYSDLPGELVGQGLPDWLQDADEIAAVPVVPLEESVDIPDWLADSIPAESGFSGTTDQLSEDDKEWTAVLQDLPPAAPIQERMAKAEIPDWILALQPGNLGDEDTSAVEEAAPVHEGGPLAGIRDVIVIEPVIAETGSNRTVPSFTISQEQLSQAALLKQLALVDKRTAQTFQRNETSSSGLVRLLLAGLLLAAILLGLLRPNLLRQAPAIVPARLTTAHSAIENAAGKPVLLAVEYTPAMAGELDVQMEMILAQLAANGSPVVTVSQSAAGTAVTQRLAADIPTLGLLPGQSVGLRQLGDCLAGKTACKSLAGKTLTGAMQQSLANVDLIIVLTGERDSLVGWLEQVALSGNIPMVAGVTQSLAPVALPYLDTAQLQGMIGGLPETAVYQQELLNQTPDDTIMRQLGAQTLAQLLAAVLLLVGGLTFGIINLLKRGGER